MKVKQFEVLVKMTQPEMKKFLKAYLEKHYKEVHCEDGFVYAQGEKPILLVAHMDTVHKETPEQILFENGKISSPQGIGGDDRCGILMILEVIKHHKCSVLFTEDEEVGGIGANKFTKSELAKSLGSKFDFIIEFDRKGSNDAVFYDCANEDFEAFVTKEYFKTNYGSFSDISIVAPDLKVAAVNLSCGYYNAHTKEEYVVWDEMVKITQEAIKLIDRADGTKFEYIENMYGGWYRYNDEYAFYDMIGYDDVSAKILFGIEYEFKGMAGFSEVYANNEDEAVGKFLREFQNLTYGDILCIDKYDDEFLK